MKLTKEERTELSKKSERDNMEKINNEIDNHNIAYKVKDQSGNEFVYAGLESGFPVFRTQGGMKHIFDIDKYEVIEKYLSI
jgi:hypothetical protein